MPKRLEHLVAGQPVGLPVGDNKRFGNQARQGVEGLPIRELVVGHDRGDRGRIEGAGENAEPVEDGGFRSVEERVRPLDRGAERLVPFDRGTPAAGEESEALVQMRGDLGRAHGGDTCCCELQCERQSVEPPTDLADRVDVGAVQFKIASDSTRALGE